jgi:hypothetical protein
MFMVIWMFAKDANFFPTMNFEVWCVELGAEVYVKRGWEQGAEENIWS